MEAAQYLHTRRQDALRDFMRALMRPTQWRYITYVLGHHRCDHERPLEPEIVLFHEATPLNEEGATLISLRETVQGPKRMQLAHDILLPWPQDRVGLLDCLVSIGGNKNPWRQDTMNHRVELWEPLGIGWVRGGNHSIATGIIKREGEVEVTSAYDIRPVYNHVRCDGQNFLRTDTGTVIAPVKNAHFAAAFEIGRML
jgi:hypothetical protein